METLTTSIVLNSDPTTNLLAALPAILMTALAVASGLMDAFFPASRRRQIGLIVGLSLFGVALIALLVPPPSLATEQLVLGGMFRFDGLTQIFTVITLIAAGIVCLITLDAPQIGRMGEFYAVLVVATLGGILMAGSADLIMAFLALETLSISLYILSGFLVKSPRSAEAGIKYFLFGGFTSAIMLYGFSLLYGFTGATNFYAIGERMAALSVGTPAPETLVPILIALVMTLVASASS